MKNATPPPAENTRYGYKNNEGHRLHVNTVGVYRDHVELAIAGVGDLDWRSLNIPAAEVPGIALALLKAAGVTPKSEHYGLEDDPTRSLRVATHYLNLHIEQTQRVALAPDSITINRAEDAPAVALDALELHGIPPTDTGGWRTAMEQSFKETSDADLVYTAWLHLKALSLRADRVSSAARAELTRRRDELAQELYVTACGVDDGINYSHRNPVTQAAIDMIIQLQDEATK